ncbi:adenosine deaminase [Cumulibacter manganitolerans]|uniref:adenosine deaminase n=1 Tax=Cumulibacter manganitolerans TaxID=1884992 RepID=UPI001297AAD3|nr:adenosine deaminase [Cumulibacter manganitolerans]
MTVPPHHPLREFIAGLPKAELHVHHVGSASPAVVAELASRHPGAVPTDPAELAAYFTFTDFAHFVELYLSVVDLVRTPEDVRSLTFGVARDLAAQGVRYAELTCTPETSVIRGIAPEAYVEAIEDARLGAEREFGIELQWIFDIAGENGVPGADTTLMVALDHGPSSLVGFGLGGPEIGVPRPQFKPHFDAARSAGLRSVPHAGESTGPQTMWDAIDHLHAERIGHGIAAVHDPRLMEVLAERQISLEVCPTSNVATRCVETLEAHPLRTLVEAGVPVTINSDDPPMFGTTLCREYEIAADLLSLDRDGVADLAREAVRRSFAPDATKTRILQQIDDYAAKA